MAARTKIYVGGSARVLVVSVVLLAVLLVVVLIQQGGFLNFHAQGPEADSHRNEVATQSTEVVSQERPELNLGRTAAYDYDPPPPGSYQLPRLKPAGDGPVLGLDGRAGKLREMMDGHITVLSFIYTRCADPSACPYALSVLYKIHSISELDPVIADNLRLITFSFDPEHDSPRVLSGFTQALQKNSGADWLFLTTAGKEDLAPILESYGQQVDRRKDPKHELGPLSHLLRVYLIDRQGMIRNIYSSGMLDPRLVLTDVRTLLFEEQQVGQSKD